jgi:SRSO17 transposase
MIPLLPAKITYMQAKRFFIEHAFKEAKSVLGIYQFQTRKWIAWYHQIALNMLLLIFISQEKLLKFKQLPLLSAWDIKQVMQFLIFTTFTDIDNLFDHILKRHQIR